MSTAATMNGASAAVPHTIHDHSDHQFDDQRRIDKSARRTRKTISLPKIQQASSYPKLSDFVAGGGSTNGDDPKLPQTALPLRHNHQNRQEHSNGSDRSPMNGTYTMTNGGGCSLAAQLAAARARMLRTDPIHHEYVLPGAITDHRRSQSLDRYVSKPKLIRRDPNATVVINRNSYRQVSEPITRPESRQLCGAAERESTTMVVVTTLNLASTSSDDHRPWSDHRLPSIHQRNHIRDGQKATAAPGALSHTWSKSQFDANQR